MYAGTDNATCSLQQDNIWRFANSLVDFHTLSYFVDTGLIWQSLEHAAAKKPKQITIHYFKGKVHFKGYSLLEDN